MNKYKIYELLGTTVELDTEKLAEMPENTKLADVGLDSIRFIRFIVALEDEFEIEVNDSDLLLEKFETFQALFDTLQKYFMTSDALKKVLICDCDNVLWHGISGEENIYSDPDTESLHKVLLELKEKGILLCLCSKNDADNITASFDSLDIPLKTDDFAVSKINHKNKPENILQIADELNLSTDSFVFIDDSSYETGLVKALLPDVTTITVSYQNNSFIQEIKACFSETPISSDRTQQYHDQKEREKEKMNFTTVEEYNASLNTTVICEKAGTNQAERISELSLRTNQFNLSNTRYTIREMEDLIENPDYDVLYLSVSDRYGDMGIVGAAVVCKKEFPVIESFFLSCRVFERGFELRLLEEIKKISTRIAGVYHPNDKNSRFRTFYTDNGVTQL